MAGREQRHRKREGKRKSGDSPLPRRTRPGTWKKSMRVKLLISLTLIACSAG